MIAMELSGVHVGRKMRITYRFKSWPKDEPDRTVAGTLYNVEHKRGGEVYVYGFKARRLPFNAEVELLD